MFFRSLEIILDKTDGDGKVYFQNLDVSIAMCLKPPPSLLFKNISSFRCITKTNLLIHVNLHIKELMIALEQLLGFICKL